MEHKHGCVVLHHGKIMSSGYNYDRVQYKHKNKYKYGCTNTSCSTHAEMSAILSLKGKKANALLVIRIGKDGSLRDSKPCQYCYEFIHKIGIKKVYFSTDNQKVEIMRTKHIDCKELKISGSNIKLKQGVKYERKIKV